MRHVIKKGTWNSCIGDVIRGGLSNFVTEERGTKLRATQRGWGDLLDRDGGNDGSQKAAAEEKMGGFLAAGWRGSDRVTRVGVAPSSGSIGLTAIKVSAAKTVIWEAQGEGGKTVGEEGEAMRGEQRKVRERRRKPWGWGKSVRVGGKRGNSRRYKHFERES